MHRDIAQLAATTFDVLVVGGGVYGACAAWEATLRGLKVALVEADDFAHATSGNSLRTMHGGLRYLQQLDVPRMRESIRERREWLRLAPDLVHPMRFSLPTIGYGIRGPFAMRAALALNDIISLDRNSGLPADHCLPRGRVMRRASARDVSDGTDRSNGVALWYDAICASPERLVLDIIKAAAAGGAVVANYARAVRLLQHADQVQGVCVRDELSGQVFEVRARIVINAAGPWVDEWLPELRDRPSFRPSKAFNLVLRSSHLPEARGLSVPTYEREDCLTGTNTLFFIPWHGFTLVGTRHLRCDGAACSADVTREEIISFIDDVNRVAARKIATEDVLGVFAGLLPLDSDADDTAVGLLKRAQVIEHRELSGLISIVGVKWTTARAVAERAIVIACKTLRRSSRLSAPRRLYPRQKDFAARIHALGIDEIVYAVRNEMACRLWDVVRRRTHLYLSENVSERTLRSCAALMGRELGWNTSRVDRETAHACTELERFRGPLNVTTLNASEVPAVARFV